MSFCVVTLQQYTLGIRKGAGLLAGVGGPGRSGCHDPIVVRQCAQLHFVHDGTGQ
jgi:hypothetical protein